MLKLVAPHNMGAESQALFLKAAEKALEGIRVEEIKAVSVEVMRTVSDHRKIVPTIAKLVSDKRARSARMKALPPPTTQADETKPRRCDPFSTSELAALSRAPSNSRLGVIRKMGLGRGWLAMDERGNLQEIIEATGRRPQPNIHEEDDDDRYQ